MVDAFRRFISDVPRHLREKVVVDAIVAHAGVVPQRVLVRNNTGTGNSCYGIALQHNNRCVVVVVDRHEAVTQLYGVVMDLVGISWHWRARFVYCVSLL